MSLYSIILCGGPGSRLWPESTQARPKPFIPLLGARSLFQRTVERMAKVSGGRPPLIVTGVAHVDHVRDQLRAIGAKGEIIAEPIGRDSGPALLAAALWIARDDPAGVAVAVASDHHIPDDAAFAAATRAALPAAEAGEIVTFGVRPDHPATAYGYIRAAEALGEGSAVARVARFVEKPDLERATALLAEGCLWNSGNFMFRAEALLAEAGLHAPDLLAATRAALDGALPRDGFLELGPLFATAPRRSIDVAVMERTRRAAVLPIDHAWTDLGSWDAVLASMPRDQDGNSVSGQAVARDSAGSLVRAGPGVRIVVLGLKDVAVVARDGDVLVTALGAAPGLKPALEALEALGPRPGETSPPPVAEGIDAVAGRLKAWLWTRALPLWWCFGADHELGGYHESLGPDLRAPGQYRRIRVQARQVHVYALAGMMGWPGPWRAAVRQGLDYLQARYRRPDGLYRALVDPRGAPLDETAVLYDQAFVLLALASAAEALPEQAPDLAVRAMELEGAIRRDLAHPAGGFVASDRAPDHLANPLMHLFESAQAWERVSEAPVWARLSRELAGLFLDRLYDPVQGRIREVFDADWRPAPGAAGRLLEPGHHFEWAWLIGRWGARHEDVRAARAARDLYVSGERGVEPVGGLVVDALWDDFSVDRATSRLWPQTERVRAAVLMAALHPAERSLRLADAASAAAAMERYFDTPTPGLWRDEPGPANATAFIAPASSFYHIIGAIAALNGY